MAKKAMNFRFDETLIERVDTVRGAVDRTAWIESAMNEKLAETEVFAKYECPWGSACDFKSNSPGAVCPQHGRKVVPRG